MEKEEMDVEEGKKTNDKPSDSTDNIQEGEDGYGSCVEEEKALVDKEQVLSNPG